MLTHSAHRIDVKRPVLACLVGLAFLVVPGSWAPLSGQAVHLETGAPLVYHAYFRKPVLLDPGTAHILIANTTTEAVAVDRFSVNGYPIERFPDDLVYWCQAVPPVAQPGEIIDVMAKLRRPTQKLVRVRVRLSNGEDVVAVFDAASPPLKFSFIGYSQGRDKVYMYLENTGERALTFDKLFTGLRDVTDLCFVPDKTIPPFSKALLVLEPDKPLRPGQYVAFKAQTREALSAAAVSRVYSHFPIAEWTGDTRKGSGFDPDYFLMRFPGAPSEIRRLAEEPLHRAYHVFSMPPDFDGDNHLPLGSSAASIVRRAKVLYDNDPLHPTFVDCGYYRKPLSYFVYGETVDILVVNPYQMAYSLNPALDNAKLVALAKRAAEPRPLWTMPEAFATDFYEAKRFPQPEELRIIVYSEIGEGSKGIWYFARKMSARGQGYEHCPPLEAEVGKINRELQVLREWIVVGDTFPINATAGEGVLTYSLLCGEQAIVLLLINGDHLSRFIPPRELHVEEDPNPDERWAKQGEPLFLYTPKPTVRVTCRVPERLEVTEAFEVEDGRKVPLAYSVGAGETTVTVGRLDISKQIVLRTEARR